MSNHGLTKENLLRTLPISLSGDPKMVALAEAIAGVLAQRREEIARLAVYPNVSQLDEGLLDILARDFKVDWWDSDYSLDEKRRTMATSWQVHKTLGTKAAVETALRAIYPQTQVIEWFEYGARPYHFKLHINITDDEMDSAKQKRVLARLEYYKNLRSHLDGITYFLQAAPASVYAGTAAFGTYQWEGAKVPLPDSVGWPTLKTGLKTGVVYLGEQRRITAQLPTVELHWPRAVGKVGTGAAAVRTYEKIQMKRT